MIFKRTTAAILSAAIIPFSSCNLIALSPSTAFAEEKVSETELPDWIPSSYESALEFRNTYGTTHIENGLLCIVFKEDRECERKGETQGKPHYSFSATKDIMEQLSCETYGTDTCRYDYEVVVFKPLKSGNFDIALADNWVKSSSLEPQFGYVHYIDYFTFSIDENKNIEQTDRFSWMPDCLTEYKEYVKKNGEVSVKDNLLVFALDSANGTPFRWLKKYTGFGEYFEQYELFDCSEETEIIPDGGTQHLLEVFEAKKDGCASIAYELTDKPTQDEDGEVQRELCAECAITDNAKTILLPEMIRMKAVDADTGELLDPLPTLNPKINVGNDIDYSAKIDFTTNPYIWKDGMHLNYSTFQLDLKYLPHGYVLPEDYYQATKYENGAIDIVYKLKKLTGEPEAGQVKVTLIDSDTGELITDEYLKENPFLFKQQLMVGRDISSYTIETNPCIFKAYEFSSVYDKDNSAGYWNNQLADEPEIKENENGSVELTFKYPTRIKGDINGDGIFSISDAALLQKWLLGAPNAIIKNWECADFCKDGQLDSFDLCLMKKSLLEIMKIPVSLSIHETGGIMGMHDKWDIYESNGKFFVSKQDMRRETPPKIVEIPEQDYRSIMSIDYSEIINKDLRTLPRYISDDIYNYTFFSYADGTEAETDAGMSSVLYQLEAIFDENKEHVIEASNVPVEVVLSQYGGIEGGTQSNIRFYYENGKYFMSKKLRTSGNSDPVITRITERDYRQIMSIDYRSYVDEPDPNQGVDNIHFFTHVTYSDGSIITCKAIIGDLFDIIERLENQ